MHPDANRQQTAKQIEVLVRTHPGMTRSDLRRATHLAWSTVSYHVGRLAEAGRITILGSPKQQYLFPPTTSDNAMRRLVALERPGARSIMALFASVREANVPLVMERTGLTRRVARARLHDLEAAGILERRGTGHPRFAMPERIHHLAPTNPAGQGAHPTTRTTRPLVHA